jgi:hypothetical protein
MADAAQAATTGAHLMLLRVTAQSLAWFRKRRDWRRLVCRIAPCQLGPVTFAPPEIMYAVTLLMALIGQHYRHHILPK